MHAQRIDGGREHIALSFSQVPETCPAVRAILEEVQEEFMSAFKISAEDTAICDAIISRAFCQIRDQATHPLRQALVMALSQQPL